MAATLLGTKKVSILVREKAYLPIDLTVEGSSISERLGQLAKAYSPIDIIVDGNVTLRKFEHQKNMLLLIVRHEDGMTMLVNSLQPLKTSELNCVDSGMSILVIPLKLNAARPTDCKVSGSSIWLRLLQELNASYPMVSNEGGRLILTRLVQDLNASFPIDDTVDGNVILSKLLQPLNAAPGIDCNESGRVTVVSLMHFSKIWTDKYFSDVGKVTLTRLLHPENNLTPID